MKLTTIILLSAAGLVSAACVCERSTARTGADELHDDGTWGPAEASNPSAKTGAARPDQLRRKPLPIVQVAR
ncbi:MAG: hypothetical protein HOW73_12145 [Polyangiaceae bacterium]|nr:hypothetical protein [Polyangiaceae bacterium]